MALFGFGTKRQLKGRRIAILATHGVEQVELTSPRTAIQKAGGCGTGLSTQTSEGRKDKGVEHYEMG